MTLDILPVPVAAPAPSVAIDHVAAIHALPALPAPMLVSGDIYLPGIPRACNRHPVVVAAKEWARGDRGRWAEVSAAVMALIVRSNHR